MVIMLTGYSTVDSAVYALRHGAFDYLRKPISTDEIFDRVQDSLLHARRERQRDDVLLKARQLLYAGIQQLDEVVPEPVDLTSEVEAEEERVDPDRFLERGPLTVDTYRHKATLNGELLDLTAGEYDLLLCLARHAPQVMSPPKIVQETKGYECSLVEAREIVRWQVYLLRQKVELDPSSPQYVLNVRGRGYMWAGA
jgi:DNA-binding response OmpR family regulator